MSSVTELVAAARGLGVDEVGVSDHLTLHPARPSVSWSMPPDRVGDYTRDVRQAAEEAAAEGGPSVRLGLEVDWLDGQAGVIRETLDGMPLDFVIGSVHFDGETELDGTARVWAGWTVRQRDRVHRAYWRRIAEMARSGLFDIVGHIDLTKKFGYRPSVPIDDVVDEALDAVAAGGLVVELNTNGWHCPCAEAYPAPEILQRCRDRGIDVTISADAHRPEHLVRDFARAADVLVTAGYGQVARFAGRRARLEPIASAVPASPGS